jgi:phosphoglycolate phosphatase
MTPARAYLFDLDGTLTDARDGLHASFRAALAALSIADRSDADLDRFLGTPLPEMFRTLKPGIPEADVAKGMNAFRAAYEVDGIWRNRLYPGVPEMLDAVTRRGCAAWVVTSKPEHYAIQVVKDLALGRHIAGVVGAGLSETDTKTSLVARALAAARVQSDNALMLGDRFYDIEGATANRVAAVGALWGYGSRAELLEAGCTMFAGTADEFRVQFVETDRGRSGALWPAGRVRGSTGT